MGSCSKEETTDLTTSYTMGFMSIESSDLTEFDHIDHVYRSMIGVNSDEFTLSSDTKTNDTHVKSACLKAQDSLRKCTFTGYYVFQVQRGSVILHNVTYGKK